MIHADVELVLAVAGGISGPEVRYEQIRRAEIGQREEFVLPLQRRGT